MNSVETIKLVTGEEIIGRVVHTDLEFVHVEKPVMLSLTEQGLGFAPVCISISDASSFKFKHSHIVFQAPTRKELSDQYLKATTGIQIATGLK